ncbi:MAG: hypothetical protein AAFX05_00870 [Planctomycetota bacterium]
MSRGSFAGGVESWCDAGDSVNTIELGEEQGDGGKGALHGCIDDDLMCIEHGDHPGGLGITQAGDGWPLARASEIP